MIPVQSTAALIAAPGGPVLLPSAPSDDRGMRFAQLLFGPEEPSGDMQADVPQPARKPDAVPDSIATATAAIPPEGKTALQRQGEAEIDGDQRSPVAEPEPVAVVPPLPEPFLQVAQRPDAADDRREQSSTKPLKITEQPAPALSVATAAPASGGRREPVQALAVASGSQPGPPPELGAHLAPEPASKHVSPIRQDPPVFPETGRTSDLPALGLPTAPVAVTAINPSSVALAQNRQAEPATVKGVAASSPVVDILARGGPEEGNAVDNESAVPVGRDGRAPAAAGLVTWESRRPPAIANEPHVTDRPAVSASDAHPVSAAAPTTAPRHSAPARSPTVPEPVLTGPGQPRTLPLRNEPRVRDARDVAPTVPSTLSETTANLQPPKDATETHAPAAAGPTRRTVALSMGPAAPLPPPLAEASFVAAGSPATGTVQEAGHGPGMPAILRPPSPEPFLPRADHPVQSAELLPAQAIPPTAGQSQVAPTLDLDRPATDWSAALAGVAGGTLLPAGGTLEIALEPERLGPLRITVEVSGAEASVTVVAATPDAARIIAQATPDLATALAAQGLTLAGQQASTQGQGGGTFGGGPPIAHARRPDGAAEVKPAPHHTQLVNLIA